MERESKILCATLMGLAMIVSAALAAEEKPLTLADCYALALKQSETIAIRQELIAEAEHRFTRALSDILPRASFSSSDKRQDGTDGSAFTLKEVPERKFVFSQPLFSGFKEFAAMRGTKAERRQRTHEKHRAEQLLLADVSDAFYLVLEKRQEIQVLGVSRQALLERIEELQGREQLGRSRLSEVVSAQALAYRVEAELEQVRSEEAVAGQLLEFLTGKEKIGGLADSDPFPPSVEGEEHYLAQAVSRWDVQAAQEETAVAEEEVKVQKADYWPTVDLEGNYFVERVGASEEVDWDAALKVDVPIYQGGQVRGAVRQAQSQAAQARLRFSETRRRAIQEIRDSYARFRAALGRTEALTRALDATQESYLFQVQEYRLNLVGNLDVLEELQVLQEARRDLIRAQFEAKRLYWSLKVASGETL